MAELDPRDAVAQALAKYPVLNTLGLNFQNSPAAGPNVLEFWPPGEPGSPGQPRPSSLPTDKPGIETFGDRARPIDVLGDATSHYLVENDPKYKGYYEQFAQSLSPDQHDILQSQFQHAQQNYGETRPYDQWLKSSGMPAYFRGYAFQQWPQEFNERAYTPDQRSMFDKMMQDLSAPVPVNAPMPQADPRKRVANAMSR